MFCPNCGAQNVDTATACAKCGFALRAAAAAPKFKGTMLMMNAPPTAAKPAAPAAPVAPAPAAPVAPAVASAPPVAAAAPQAPKPKLKGTMIGVAPPSLGSNSPLGGAPSAPPVAQPPAAYSAPAPAYEPPPAPAYAPPPAQSIPQPVSSVNPLGGTVVADAGAFGGFPQAPPTASAPGSYDIGGPPPGFGAPPPGFGNSDALGATAPVASGAPHAMVPAQPAAMSPVPPAPMANYDEPMDPIPGTVGGPNPIITVLLIVLTCGIYGIYLLIKGKRQPQQ